MHDNPGLIHRLSHLLAMLAAWSFILSSTVLAAPVPVETRSGTPDFAIDLSSGLPSMAPRTEELLLAQDGGEGGGGGGDGGNSPSIVGQRGVNNAQTGRAIQILRQGEAECGSIQEPYRVDCLSYYFGSAARALRAQEYAPARRELQIASQQLESIVTANLDTSKPPIRRGFRRQYRPVKEESVPQVNAQARQVITRTEDRLIRSAGSSERRRSHYAAIAQAAGSTKRILRS